MVKETIPDVSGVELSVKSVRFFASLVVNFSHQKCLPCKRIK